jgi:uncharacterized protein (TIGR03790 family)
VTELRRRLVRFVFTATAFFLVVSAIRPALALTPDEILLITNKNSPDSRHLAQLYCELRNVPSAQIVTLDLPTDEEMSFETYETNVVGPVRQFLNDHQLKSKIKCLLTFYGVPFRIRDKVNTPADDRELAELKYVRGDTADELQKAVESFETVAVGLNPSFTPGTSNAIGDILARSQSAITATTAKIPAMTDPNQRADILKQLVAFLGTLGGEEEVDARLGANQRDDPDKSPAEHDQWIRLHQRVLDARKQVADLQANRWDPGARQRLRQLTHDRFGLVGLLRVLDAQIDYLNTDQTGSATDNELALLWWDYYHRQGWLENPLNIHFHGRSPLTLMVMRLDGPDPAVVERMMRTSVQVEKTGLEGTIAIDARGIAPIDDKGNLNPFGQFDETLRNLALIIRTKTHLKIALDDQDIVFPPHYVKNVACYVGWYSVANYIPGCVFNPGAVGYHIASYEMLTLHTPSSRWVRGLLTDGVVATLGAVAEPKLPAFPRPDDFFPLLLTGKLTLAEVYWKTNPMTSWMISFIGDPLYTPYKLNPPMAVEDLPPGLRNALP